MKKLWNKNWALPILALVLFFGLSLGVKEEVKAAEKVAEGKWGDNITWALDDKGTLTFEGKGEMKKGLAYGDGDGDDIETDELKVYPWTAYYKEIKTVVVKKGITNVPDSAFAPCDNHENLSPYPKLKTVRLGSTVKKIGAAAFYRCKKLSNIILPKGMMEIGNAAFYGCLNLKKINLPEKLTKISDNAFYGASLKNVVLPKSITSIGTYAFASCDMETITIPGTVKSIGSMAFAFCRELKEVTFEKNTNKELKLSSRTFNECESLKKVVLSDNIKKLDRTFEGCTSLETVQLPKNLTTLTNTFMNCKKLKKITVPSKVTTFDGKLFYKCKNLKTIVIKSKKLKLADSVNRDIMFAGISSKVSFTLPESKYNEYKKAIQYFVPKTATFKSSTGVIPEIPDEEKDGIIAQGTWGTNIKWVLEENGTITFSGKGKIEDGYTNGVAKRYDNKKRYPWAQYADDIKVAVFKKGITNVPEYFFGASYLDEVSIFSNLKTVKLGSTINEIGRQAFSDCKNLKSINIPQKVTTIGDYAFYDISPKAVITLPKKNFDKYKELLKPACPPETAVIKSK